MMFHVKSSWFILLILPSSPIFSQKMMSFVEANIPTPQKIDTSVSNFNYRQPNYNKLSKFDQEFYYWINYIRKNPAISFDSIIEPIAKVYPQLKGGNYKSLKFDLSQTQNLPMFSLNNALISIAKAHSENITITNSSPSHNSTDGKTFIDRFKSSGLKNCGSENISYGSGKPLFLIALLFLDINIPDLGHRKTLLDPTYTETGIGSSTYKDGNIFLVEDFACSQK